MKSRQFNFFILPADLQAIESLLDSLGVIFIRQPILSLNDFLLKSIKYPKKVDEFDKVYLSKKEYLEFINFEKIDEQNHYLINDVSSYVVEFSRGGFLFDDNKLERARFYYVYSFFESDTLKTKELKFQEWADYIIKSIKKEISIKKIGNHWYSKNVITWMQQNNMRIHDSGLYISM